MLAKRGNELFELVDRAKFWIELFETTNVVAVGASRTRLEKGRCIAMGYAQVVKIRNNGNGIPEAKLRGELQTVSCAGNRGQIGHKELRLVPPYSLTPRGEGEEQAATTLHTCK